MDVEDFAKYFEAITIADNVSGWQRAAYSNRERESGSSETMASDTIEFSNMKGSFDRYRFSLESDIDQELHISLYSYSMM